MAEKARASDLLRVPRRVAGAAVNSLTDPFSIKLSFRWGEKIICRVEKKTFSQETREVCLINKLKGKSSDDRFNNFN